MHDFTLHRDLQVMGTADAHLSEIDDADRAPRVTCLLFSRHEVRPVYQVALHASAEPPHCCVKQRVGGVRAEFVVAPGQDDRHAADVTSHLVIFLVEGVGERVGQLLRLQFEGLRELRNRQKRLCS